MSNTIGRVNFIASLDGRRTPAEAKTVGRKIGQSMGEGYDETWSKSFKDTLTKEGKRALAGWEANGRKSGDLYGKAFAGRLESYLKVARKNFQDLRLTPGFLDDFARAFPSAEAAAGSLQKQLRTLRNENEITSSSFRAAAIQVHDWVLGQQEAQDAARETASAQEESSRRHREAMDGLGATLREQTNQYRINAAAQEDIRARSLDDLRTTLREQTNAYAINTAAQNDADLDRIRSMIALQGELDQHARAHANLLRVQEEGVAVSEDTNREWVRTIDLSDLIRASVDRTTHSIHAQGIEWRRLSANTRQWTLIIAAVAAGAEEIAVLGSAAGAGLIALGGAATSGIIGVGGLAAVIVSLNKDLDELPPNLRAVGAEFQRFTPVFGELRETIASSAFRQLPGVFDQMGDSLRALTPGFEALGTSVGRTMRIFAVETKPGTKAFNELARSLELAGPNFEDLARTAGLFGTAFLRAFNRAQPLVEDLFGWLRRLARTFDDFTQSPGFDEWMRNAQTTFKAFGALLDATGRALNDLVSPEAVQRTAEFLGNLTEFMPNLERFLSNLGALDVFGLLAQGLNDLGRGFAPLSEAAGELFEAINRIVSISLSEFGDILVGISEAVAPLIQGFADFLDALPPDAIAGIVNGLGVLAGAFLLVRGAQGIGNLVTLLGQVDGSLATVASTGGRAGRALAGLARGGIITAALIAATTAVDTFADIVSKKLLPPLDKTASELRKASTASDIFRVAFNAQGMDGAAQSTEALKGQITGLNFAMKEVVANGKNWLDPIAPSAEGTLTLIHGLGDAFADLAVSDLPAAAAQFDALAAAAKLTGEEQAALLDRLGPFKEALAAAGIDVTGLADGLHLAGAVASVTGGQITDTGDAVTGVGEKAQTTKERIDELSDKIRDFGNESLTARSASRDYEAAIDDLTQSIADNTATLEIGSEEGRTNQAAVDALAQSVIDLTAETLEKTKSEEAAIGVMETGRAKLIEMLGAFGIVGQAAEDYANDLGLIPSNINTKLNLDTSAATGAIQGFIKSYNGRRITVYVDGSYSGGAGAPRYFASGTIATRPTSGVFGEAGPEALVPLNRPLNQVDPSVRWLSAIAQGKSARMASGGVMGGPSRQITIEAGAIVIQGVEDPAANALAILNRVAEKIG